MAQTLRQRLKRSFRPGRTAKRPSRMTASPAFRRVAILAPEVQKTAFDAGRAWDIRGKA